MSPLFLSIQLDRAHTYLACALPFLISPVRVLLEILPFAPLDLLPFFLFLISISFLLFIIALIVLLIVSQ